jgi:hypothetical protein
VIKKIWHDPVGSKVIAAGIIAGVAWVVTHFGWWSVTVPLWLALALTIPLIALTILFYRSRTRAKGYLGPNLFIDFLGDETNITHAQHKWGEKLVSLVYVRVRVRNTGGAVAKGCVVYLTELKEMHPGGSTVPTAIEDSKVLPWAGWHFSPKNVPPDGTYYADVVRISKDERGWLFCEGDKQGYQQRLKDYLGTYRFRVMVVDENTSKASCEIDVTYNGDWHNLRATSVTTS